jgi:hypothetical protein
MSICPDPYSGFVIPFWSKGENYWSESEELIVWQHLSNYLADSSCRKTCHNGFYEYFVFVWRHKCLLCGWSDDSMLGFWELYPELAGRKDDEGLGNKNKGLAHSKKNLGVVSSLCTLEPYYKDDRLASDPIVKLEYNFKDSAVTEESKNTINLELSKTPRSLEHYRFNVSITSPITYLNLRGCRLDLERLAYHRQRESNELQDLQNKVNEALCGPALDAGVLTRKRKTDPYEFNVKSTKQKQWLLYTYLGYKPSGRWGPVTDEETILRCYAKDRNPTLRLIIQAIRKRTRLSDIEKLTCNSDGRIRTALDIVGTNTGRLSARESMAMQPSDEDPTIWENTGTNLQNVTKDLRDCFIPDTDQYDFWQFDLRGADAWTVAADLAALGVPTMLEDLLAGIKPAKVLMALLQEYEAGRDPSTINNLSRPQLKQLVNSIEIPPSSKRDSAGRPGDWKYDVCKKVQHGTNYDAKPATISTLVFVDSDGLVDLTDREASIYQHLYKLRYKPQERNNWIRTTLARDGVIIAACGIRRKFFSIRNCFNIEDDIVRQAAAFEPQANTTYCTNAALKNLWNDPNNRQSTGWLFCDPLLQIHDALAGQNHSSIRKWAHRKLRSYFGTTLTVHNIPISIPADGGWGTSWLDTKHDLIE